MIVLRVVRAYSFVVAYFTFIVTAALFAGCSGGGTEQSVMPRGELFVLNSRTANIAAFDELSSGETAPLRIFGDITGLSMPGGMAMDPAKNEIFVANPFNNTITVYSRTASGNAAFLRTISGPSTGLDGPSRVAFDSLRRELFVVNSFNNSISVFQTGAGGNAAPLRTISGPSTRLTGANSIAVDAKRNEIYVSSSGSEGSVSVFSASEN